MLVKKSLSAVALVTLVVVPMAQADQDDEFLEGLSLEDLINIEVEVATKSKKSVTDAPSTVSVFTRREISALGVTNLIELLNLVPGFQGYKVGIKNNGGAIAARGRRASFNSFEILILYDGQRLNGERNGSGLAVNPQVALDNIKRVEVIRGPGSAIYGANAFTGIVNLISDNTLNNVKVSAGSFQTYRTSLNYAKNWDNKRWSLFASGYDREGETMPVTGFGQSLQSKDHNKGSDLYTRFESEQLTLSARYNNRVATGHYVVERIDDDFNQYDQTQYHLSGDYKWQPNETLNAKVGAFYVNTETDLNLTLAPAGALAAVSNPSSTEPYRNHVPFSSSSFGVNGELMWQLSERSELLLGVSHRKADVKEAIVGNNYNFGMLALGQIPIDYYGQMRYISTVQLPQKRNITGVFAQYDGAINDKLLVTTGIRYDNYSDFGSTLNPRLGLVYKANDIHTLKFSYGQAFRAPSPAETRISNNTVLAGNLDLQPEKIKTYEVHWSQTYKQLNLAITLFDNEITDAVALAPEADSTKVRWANSDTFKNSGAEFAAFATIGRNIYARAGYTRFFDSPDSAGNQSDSLFSGSINYQKGPVNANLSGYYHSRMSYLHSTSRTNVTLGGYTVLNSKISYQWSENATLALTIKNLTDKTYFTPPSTGLIKQGVINNGRAFELGFDFKF